MSTEAPGKFIDPSTGQIIVVDTDKIEADRTPNGKFSHIGYDGTETTFEVGTKEDQTVED